MFSQVHLTLTCSHHAEIHLLLHSDMLFGHCQEEGAVEGASVCPRVIEADVVNVNGSYLNVAILRPMPLQTVAEILVQDVSSGVVIVENLREGKRRKQMVTL